MCIRDRGKRQFWVPELNTACYSSGGFKLGFHIPVVGDKIAMLSKNVMSVQGLEAVVPAKIQKEVLEGHELGPFSAPLIPDLRVSLFGMVPKKAEGEFHLIHHLTYPEGESVNSQLPQELHSVQHTVCHLIQQCAWYVHAGSGFKWQSVTSSQHFVSS